MNLRTHRALARFGAAALLAGGAVALTAAPALADGQADLGVGIAGTTLAATTSGKEINVTLTNHGPGPATGVFVDFDLAALDTAKVEFEVPDADACRTEGDVVSCGIIDVAAGQALDLGVRLTSRGGSGGAGELTATVRHGGTDGNAANDTATAPVEIAGGGADLYAYAPDVPFDPETGRTGKVAPGGTADLLYAVGNYGDEAVAGVRLTITLPEHVTFVEKEPGCGYNAAGTVATCVYEDLPIIPADEDTDDKDKVYSSIGFYNVVRVAGDAPAPANLAGGSVEVEGIAAEEDLRAAERRATSLPRNAEGGSAADVDATDNVDEFVVYVARATGGDDGEGGGLPITGVRVGLVGAVGGAVVAAGALLLVLTRRRRVVLVAPEDQKPAT